MARDANALFPVFRCAADVPTGPWANRRAKAASTKPMIALIAAVWMSVGATPQEPGVLTVTVDVSAVDGVTLGDEAINVAYKSLMLRLIGEGYSVADPEHGGDIIITLVPTSNRANVRVEVRSSTAKMECTVPVGQTAGEEAQLRLIHETLDLVRRVRAALVEAHPQPPIPSPPSTPPAQGRPPPESHPTAVRAGSAMMWSGSSIGLLANLDVGIFRGAWQAGLGGFFHEPIDLPSELHLYEWGGGLSIGRRAMITDLVAMQADLAAGFIHQSYRYADAGGDRGSLWDPLASIRVATDWVLSPRWRVGLCGGVMLTLHDRSHVTARRQLWDGPRLRPFVGIGAEFLP